LKFINITNIFAINVFAYVVILYNHLKISRISKKIELQDIFI